MKKIFLLHLIHFLFINLNAQVKIGAAGNPDVNAVLELAGTSRGLLLPRIALGSTGSAAPLSAHTAGMVVYNTAAVSDVRPGYYYNDGVRWQRITNSLDNWSLTGNAATNPASQFLGTSDSIDFGIRTDNLERIRISAAGVIDIGTNSLPANVRIKFGGSTSGSLAATLGISGSVNATADGQTLYSFYNNPNFGTSFIPANVYGGSTEMAYAGRTSGNLVGDNALLTTLGSGSFAGINAAMNGQVFRSSTGTSDGQYYGGQFSAETANPGGGNVDGMYAIAGTTRLQGAGATTINDLGTQVNFLSITNANATVVNASGIQNFIRLSAPITLNSTIGIFNDMLVTSNGTFTTIYGSLTRMGTFGTGQMVNAFANYLEPISVNANILNYKGIYVGNIGLTSGTRRAFEYDGTGTNDPVIINYDGSVQIGTTTPVTNAKLSIVDGHLQSGQTTKPTIIVNSSMGSGASASLNDATDIAGVISLDFGVSGWTLGPQATISFNKVYANAPIVIITPTNSNAANGVDLQHPYITTSTSGFTIHFLVAASNGNVMTFNYHVIETVNN